MSLFQAREWWAHASDVAEEEYDAPCLIVANIDNAPASASGAEEEEDKIVTGSMSASGMLRVWKPRARQSSGASGSVGAAGASQTRAHMEDLLLEERTGAPILALLAGRFSAIVSGLTLAVLHPHKLSVYNIMADASSVVKAVKLYEHVFASTGAHFTAANMCSGPFGGPFTGSSMFTPSPLAVRESIAVQSMDGQIAVFEQERFAFRRACEGILLPGPIAYVPRTDSLLVMTSDCNLDSYKYSTLSGAWSSDAPLSREGKEAEVAESKVTAASEGRKLRPDWSVNLGEHAHSIVVGGRFLGAASMGLSTPSAAGISASVGGAGGPPSDIVVIGERCMYVLRDNGTPVAAAAVSAASSSGAAAATTTAIRLQKRLPHHPAAACLFARTGAASASHPAVYSVPALPSPGAPATTLGLLLATHAPSLHVYIEDSLAWAARLPYVPVAVAVGRFAGVGGLIISLSARGDVTVSYLGSDPPTGSITGGETVRDLDYARMDGEHKRLLAHIKEMQAAAAAAGSERGGADRSRTAAEGLLMRVQRLPTSLDDPDAHGGRASHGAVAGVALGTAGPSTYVDDDEWGASERVGEWGDTHPAPVPRTQPTLTVTLALSFVPPATGVAHSARDVHISVHCPSWALLPPRVRDVTVPEITPSGATLTLPFRCSRHGVPAGATVRVVAQYTLDRARLPGADDDDGPNSSGETRTCTVEFALPLALAVRVIPPVRTATYKFTIDTNRPPPPLTDIFGDLLQQPRAWLPPDSVSRITGSGASVLSFLFRCGADVSILVSKAGGRYRVQAGSLEALCMIAQALVERLARYFATATAEAGAAPFAPSYTEPLPLADYFTVVDEHFSARRALLAAYSVLNDRAHEYRLVTKRLLVRAKDRAPPPLSGLDVLMDSVQSHVLTAVANVAARQDAVAHASARLSVVNRLLVSLIAWKCGMDDRSMDLLARILPHSVQDTLECGWEETADAALTHVLKLLTRAAVAPTADGSSSSGGATTADDVAAAAAAAGGGAVATAAAAVSAGVSGSTQLAMPDSTSRLKQHISILIDKLQKGASLSSVVASSSSPGGAPSAAAASAASGGMIGPGAVPASVPTPGPGAAPRLAALK